MIHVANKNNTSNLSKKNGALQLVSEPGFNARLDEYELTTASKNNMSQVDRVNCLMGLG